MRFLQGLLLGVAIGSAVAVVADVYRPYAIGVGIAAVVLFLAVSSRTPATAGSPAAGKQARPTAGTAPGPTVPAGFFAGRRLGDALAWLAQEHGVTTLEQVGVTEESVTVLDLGPRGRRFAVVRWEDGMFRSDLSDLPAEPGARYDTSGRFQARDLAPDVLSRALDRARREHPQTWTHVVDAEAVIEQPDRLRSEVTVLLHNGSLDAEDQTLWASASGDVLYVQRSLS